MKVAHPPSFCHKNRLPQIKQHKIDLNLNLSQQKTEKSPWSSSESNFYSEISSHKNDRINIQINVKSKNNQVSQTLQPNYQTN